ncbi:MAG TPA: PLP-dependent aminotransferase family protein [Vicinamibacteria bacterium]|nr:PLP-dependent aminotransferase family protein [Vicinamibacteria bacterium]
MTSWAPSLQGREGPLYLAIADALAEDARSGRLRPGARLPTHRELADRLGVTVGTVTRGYAEAARRGVVAGEVGRGSFVRGPVELPGPGLGEADEGLVELGLNLPPPLDEGKGGALSRTLQALAQQDLSALLEYAPDGAAASHREAGAAWLNFAGLKADPARVLVSSGSQHALTVVFSAFLRPGDVLLTEALTYPGVKGVAGLLNLRLQGVPMDAHGLVPDALEAACRSQAPRALYLIPTIHNPTTVVLSETRRREIARIARAHNVIVVEDDVHRLLAEDAPPPVAALLPELTCFLLGTSKTLAPGLRVGFIHAPAPLVPRIAAGIRATTWMAAPLMAEIVARWQRDGTAVRLLKKRREEARARQRLAAELLEGYALDAHPTAHHAWLHLPEPWRAESFVAEARRSGVAVTPAQAFQVGRAPAPHAVRLGLGAPRSREELRVGLERVAAALARGAEASPMLV